MKKEEDFTSTKDKILELSKDLKSHYIKGEFIDADENFKELLEKIIVKK